MRRKRAASGILALVTGCAEGVVDSSGMYNPTMPTSATITAGVTSQASAASDTEGDSTGGDESATEPPNTTTPNTTSGSMTTRGGGVCGDGVRDFGEECDGADLADKSCQSLGYEDGVLACNPDCTLFADACFRCGDGVKDMAEACDGADLDGRTCLSEGFGGGSLSCSADCKTINTAGCTPLASCGDGVREGSEQCDGAQLGGQTCVGLGYDEGTLACTQSCTLDTSGCTTLMCAGQGEFCIFDENDLQSNCCPAGVKGNVLGLCDLILCL